MKKTSFSFGKKNFGYETDNDIGPWFQFPIPKPNVSLTLLSTKVLYMLLDRFLLAVELRYLSKN